MLNDTRLTLFSGNRGKNWPRKIALLIIPPNLASIDIDAQFRVKLGAALLGAALVSTGSAAPMCMSGNLAGYVALGAIPTPPRTDLLHF
jgi:hypothetical protein